MKITYFLTLVIAVFLFACTSETQDKGLKEIAETWGPVTEASKGISTGTSEGTGKYFEVEVTNPEFFKEDADRVGIAGGIAFLLYKNFSEEEKKDYMKYDIKLNDGANHVEEYNFKSAMVSQFYLQEKTANNYLQKLINGNFDYINDQYIEAKKIGSDSLRSVYTPLIEKFGAFKKVETYNIQAENYIFKDSSKLEVLSFRGSVIKEKGAIPFLISLDPTKKENNIVTIKYRSE